MEGQIPLPSSLRVLSECNYRLPGCVGLNYGPTKHYIWFSEKNGSFVSIDIAKGSMGGIRPT